MSQTLATKPPAIGIFERYLSIWVLACIAAGIVLGQAIPGLFHLLGTATIAQINLPVALLVWLMIGFGHRGRRAGRSSGDADRRSPRPPLARLV